MNNQTGIIEKPFGETLGTRYLDYAMYVARLRALPDVRDGLKPVHRRILYSMNGLGLGYNKPYKKSARTVGDVLGRLHPHGDASVYEAMVILSQAFSMRYPLVDGHGNFGSIDGDKAAAMRYTESRLSRLGQYLMADIKKGTVDFKPNYDGEEEEPTVLPGLFPNLLCNGIEGIAVGFASNIPSHNLKDVYRCLYYMIDKKLVGEDATIDELIKLIGAPDFPTAGEIVLNDDLLAGYRTGKGKITLRGKYKLETTSKGVSVIITEIPYKVNKTSLVNSIADSIRDVKNSKGTIVTPAKFPQIKEVRDESNKDGIRIVLELKKDENHEILMNNIIKFTKYQSSIKMNMITLIDKTPVETNLEVLLSNFLMHSADVILRKSEFNLEKDTIRLNFVEGILKLFENDMLSRVIETIRKSDDPEKDLINMGFNEAQAKHICDMKLRSIAKASQANMLKEKEQLTFNIELCSSILNDPVVLLSTMKKEFKECEEIFGDERRTTITHDAAELTDEDLIEDETLIVTYSTDGIIKAVEESAYNTQRRGGRGVSGASTKEDEAIKFMFTTDSKDDLLFFTNTGRCYTLKAYKIGKSTKSAKGRSINNYLTLEPGEKILNILNTNIKNNTDGYLLMITKNGILKKLSLKELSIRYSYTKVMTFKDEDELIDAQLIIDENVMIVTKKGQSLKISTSLDGSKAIRPMGRTAAGVKGMTLKEDDEVISMFIVRDNDTILTVSEKGLGKRTKESEWSIIGRGSKGVVAHKLSDKTGDLICALVANNDEELFMATANGLIQRIKTTCINECGRSSIGVKTINLTDTDSIVSISTCKIEEKEEE